MEIYREREGGGQSFPRPDRGAMGGGTICSGGGYPRLMSANPPGWITPPPPLRLTKGEGLPSFRLL